MYFLAGSIIFLALICFFAALAAQTPEQKQLEDREQEEWIRAYCERKRKKGRRRIKKTE